MSFHTFRISKIQFFRAMLYDVVTFSLATFLYWNICILWNAIDIFFAYRNHWNVYWLWLNLKLYSSKNSATKNKPADEMCRNRKRQSNNSRGNWQRHVLPGKIDDDIYLIQELLKSTRAWAKRHHFALIFQPMKSISEYHHCSIQLREHFRAIRTVIVIIIQIKCMGQALQSLHMVHVCIWLLSTVETKYTPFRNALCFSFSSICKS